MEPPTLALDNKIPAFSPGTAHTYTRSCVTSGLLQSPAHSTLKMSSGFFHLTLQAALLWALGFRGPSFYLLPLFNPLHAPASPASLNSSELPVEPPATVSSPRDVLPLLFVFQALLTLYTSVVVLPLHLL